MNHNEHKQQQFSDFIPLIIIFCIIIALTLLHQLYVGWSFYSFMSDFMAFFFLIFGGFKLYNWSVFVEAFSSYDLIAQRFKLYAQLYPFIELALGFLYLFRLHPTATNIITLIIMIASSISVGYALSQKNRIECACLADIFRIPLTYVSLAEDLLMAIMALIMLLY